MKAILIHYPKCSTCQKAKKYLTSLAVDFEERHIVEQNPTVEELTLWIQQSKLDIKKFFNTSGNLYKEQKLKDKLPTMSDEEKIQLLASNGMLVKRPLLLYKDTVLVGFKEEAYQQLCK